MNSNMPTFDYIMCRLDNGVRPGKWIEGSLLRKDKSLFPIVKLLVYTFDFKLYVLKYNFEIDWKFSTIKWNGNLDDKIALIGTKEIII
jgi:hypothetical protein